MYFSTDFLDHEDMNNNNIGLHGELSLGGINYGIDNINGMNGAMASHILSCLNCANEFSATNSVRLPRKLICGHTFCGQCMSTMLISDNILDGSSFTCAACFQLTRVYGGVDGLPSDDIAMKALKHKSEQNFNYNSSMNNNNMRNSRPFLCGNCEGHSAKFKCQQCEEECAFLCPDCAGKHNEMKAFRRHEVVELSPYMLHQHAMMAQQSQSRSPSQMYSQQANFMGHNNSNNSTPVKGGVPITLDGLNIGYSNFECDLSTYDMLTNFNGLKIREIMEQTGCNIHDDELNGTKIGWKSLGLRGTKYQIESALRVLKSYLPNASSPDNSVFSRIGGSPSPMTMNRGSQRTSVRLITIARENIDTLMNSRGAVLNDIMTKSGAQISVKNDALTHDEAENGMMCLQVGGNTSEVEYALSLIKSYTGQSSNTRENSNPHSPVKTSPTGHDYVGHGFGRDFDIYESVYSTLSASSSPYDQRDQEPLSPNADTLYLDCPQEKVKLVIGAKGVVIKSIMRRTKTVIVIDEKFPEGHPRKVEIKGKAENIRQAQQMIQSVIDSGPTSIDEFGELQSRGTPLGEFDTKKGLDNPGEKIVAIRCPAEKISIVIGAKGVIINEISRRSNTQISIDEDPRNSIAASAQFLLGGNESPPESDMASNFSLRRIEIRGLPADIEIAKGLIEAVVTSGPNVLYSADIGKNGVDIPKPLAKKSIEIPCPKEKVGALIGSKGTIIKEIMRKTNTQISIAEEIVDQEYLDSGVVTSLESRMVNIRGNPEDIEICKQTIEEIIGNEYSQEGKTFSLLSSVSPNISLGELSSSPVDRAKMPSAFPSLPAQESFETITVPLDRMREIIGIKGVIIKKISSKSGAKIIVNNELPTGVPRILEIRGTTQQINKAKDLLKGILDSKEVGTSKESNTSMESDDKDYFQRDKISVSPDRSRKNRIDEVINFVAPNAMETILSRKKLIDKIILCSGAEINSQRSDVGSIQLNVEGYSSNVQDAIRLINKLFSDIMENEKAGKNTSSLLFQKDQDVRFEIFDCPGPKFSLLTDNKLSIVKEIRRRSSATIVLMKSRHSSPHSSLAYNMAADVWRRVAIISTFENVSEAKSLLHGLVTKGENPIKISNSKRGQFGDFCSDDEEEDDDDNEDFDDESEYDNFSDDDFNRVLDFDEDYDDDDDDEDALNDDGEEVNVAHCSIECPNDKVGLVIGFKGVVIKSMMKRSKAKIVVIGTVVNGKTTRVVEIKGTEAQVAVARQMVECVITHGADALDQSGKASMALGIITKFVDVTTDDFKQLASVLGPGLKIVAHSTNAAISVIGPNPKRNEDHNLRRISVKGTQNCVEIALKMIKETMDRLNIDMSVIVDKDFKNVDDTDSVGSPSKDKSPPESPLSASGAAKLAKKVQVVTRTVHCPSTRVGTLIGTRGVIVKEIMKRSGATIVVAESTFLDDSDPAVEVREVLIKGSKNSVAQAEKIVTSLIEHGTKVLNKGFTTDTLTN